MLGISSTQKAYGLLWLSPSKCKRVLAARKALLEVLTREEKIAAVGWASENAPPQGGNKTDE